MTALLVIATMAVLISTSMRDGFAQYLLKGELIGLQPLGEALAARHNPTRPGWPEFRGDPKAWQAFVNHEFRPPRRDAPPPPGGPMPVGARMVLLDASGNQIAGASSDASPVERIAIRPADASETSAPIGWLGLTAPPGARTVSDAFYLRGQFRSLVIASLAAIAISAIAAFLLARQFLAPIHALEAGAQTLAGGNYAARIPNNRGDELGRLIDHYNDLAASLEAAEIAEKQWVSDTSHELQTPLAVLRAQIEAVQDGVREADDKTLAAMHSAVLRLTRLVNDLRTLARGRERGFDAEFRSTNVTQILNEALDATAERFEAAGLELLHRMDTPMKAQCDPIRIRQVIDNLLENALRYTDAPGRVRLGAWADGGLLHIELADSAPAPSHSSLPQLFDRFHRGEASRARALGGSGLGLAICKVVIEAHGGNIWATMSDLGGLQVHITLPVKGKST
ncbi:ATP-binding protein [Shimia sp.]|uniref:ATP-binding protein n=1 Tax=Shimia sp. TaxID=1954381 RepID=UPI0032979FF8